jgi:hypothetical protein
VQAVSSNLEQIKQQLSAAHEASTKQQASAESSLKRQASRHQQQLTAVAHALRTACALLLSCMATMAASAGVLQHSMHSLQQQRHQQQPCTLLEAAAPADSGPESLAAAGAPVCAAAAAAAAGLADMVALSGEELADLLGPEDDTCRMLLQQLQAQQTQEQQQLQELDAAAGTGRELGAKGAAAARVLAQVRQGSSQALAALEAEGPAAQQQQGLLQQLEEVVEQFCSSSSSTQSGSQGGGSAGCAAVSDASGSVRGPYRPGSASSAGAGKGGGGCVEQKLQSVLQLLTQDVGAQQGSLRSAVCMTVTTCS